MSELFWINLFWVAVLIFLEERWRAERRDLYSRLMARDLTEYQAMQSGSAPRGRNFVLRNLVAQLKAKE